MVLIQEWAPFKEPLQPRIGLSTLDIRFIPTNPACTTALPIAELLLQIHPSCMR
jgi:hypothetical protein